MTTGTSLTRRRWVVLLTLLIGAVSLSFTLRLQPGDDRFLPGAAWMLVVWAVGAWASGPLPAGDRGRRGASLMLGMLVGLLAVAVCLAGGLIAAHLPALRDPAEQVLAFAGSSTAIVVALTLLNGVAEELFFRGALYDALPSRLAIPVTTGIYALTTAGSGVVLLVVAAVLLGAGAALLRRRTGGLLAPIALHLTWSVGMLLLLPSVLS